MTPDGKKRQIGLENVAKLWSTPRSSMSENRTTKPAPSHGTTHGRVLAGEAAAWATPTSRDHKDGTSPSENAPTNGLLGRQAPRWATPKAVDGYKPSAGRRRASDLSHHAQAMPPDGLPSSNAGPNSRRLWPTPRVEPGTSSKVKGKTYPTSLEYMVPKPTPAARLNPRFVAWLMGLHPDWANPDIALTSSERSATPSCRSAPRSRSECSPSGQE
jgi:hypothetical protein